MTGSHVRIEIPAVPQSAGIARAKLRGELVGVTDDVRADVELVLTELVSNAVRHVGGSVSIVSAVVGSELRLEVSDESSQQPILRPVDNFHEFGRGLQVVDALCSAWGVTTRAHGKTVWCLMDLRP